MQIMCMQKKFVNILNEKLGVCHDLYVQSDILFLADVFEKLRHICLKK